MGDKPEPIFQANEICLPKKFGVIQTSDFLSSLEPGSLKMTTRLQGVTAPIAKKWSSTQLSLLAQSAAFTLKLRGHIYKKNIVFLKCQTIPLIHFLVTVCVC